MKTFINRASHNLLMVEDFIKVLDVIKKRRSIRKYKDIPVPWDKIQHILQAGQYAPNAGNLQDWKFIVVNNPGMIKQIAKACINQVWIETAPVLIVIVGITERTLQYYGEVGRKYVLENCAAAAENMLIQATAEGLGSCWVGAFDEFMLRTILRVPERATPQIVLTIGYADEEVPVPPRTVLESMTFLQTYANRMRQPHATLWNYSLQWEEFGRDAKIGAKRYARILKDKIKNKFGGDGEEKEE